MATTGTEPDTHFYTHRLPNGLQVLGQYMADVHSAAAVFYVQTGTRDERAEEMGVSHFLEHMAFRRTRNLRGEEIDRAFEEMGADHNAATGREMTFYWARVLSENVSQAIDVLAELTHPLLDADDFNQERPVILEEIARYNDIPSHILVSTFMQDFYGDHPLSFETLGTPGTIRALTVEQMREYWSRRYGAQNILFSIAGRFDWESVLQQLEALSSGWDAGESGRELNSTRFSPKLTVQRTEKFNQEQVLLGTPTVSSKDPRYFTAAVLSMVLGDDTGSRLYWSVNQPGLAESATAQMMDFEDNGVFLVHLATEPGLAAGALREVQSQLERLQRFDVDEAELDRAKAKLNSSVVIGGESTNERVMSLIRSWRAEGRLETLEEIRQNIDAVTLEDLSALLRDFPVFPHQVITAVGPVVEEEIKSAL